MASLACETRLLVFTSREIDDLVNNSLKETVMLVDGSGYTHLAPQGAIGTQLGSLLGGIAGGVFGQPQIGQQLGGLAGGFLPMAAGPQLTPQGAFGSQLGSLLGGGRRGGREGQRL